MSSLVPVIAVLLALIAAGSIAYIAWELTSKRSQDSIEASLGRKDARDENTPDD